MGGGGSDTLRGDAGADTLTGGADAYQFDYTAPGFGPDRILDFDLNGDDRIRIVGLGTAFDSFGEILAASSQVGTDVVINFGAAGSIALSNTTLASLTASDFVFI